MHAYTLVGLLAGKLAIAHKSVCVRFFDDEKLHFCHCSFSAPTLSLSHLHSFLHRLDTFVLCHSVFTYLLTIENFIRLKRLTFTLKFVCACVCNLDIFIVEFRVSCNQQSHTDTHTICTWIVINEYTLDLVSSMFKIRSQFLRIDEWVNEWTDCVCFSSE